MFYRQFRTLRSPIAQSDSKIPCRYHFQVDYELCACDVILLSSFKTEIVSTSIYSIIFNIADERLNLVLTEIGFDPERISNHCRGVTKRGR